MTREEKNIVIESLVEKLNNASNIYLADASGVTVESINSFRRKCFQENIKMQVVKNTLLEKAMQRTGKDYGDIYSTLKGPVAVLFSDAANAPAKLIKEFRKKGDKPVLKSAFVQESVYIGDDQLDALVSIKSKNELIGDVIGLLQSPAKNVISGLKASGGKLAGILKTLSEKTA